MIMFRCQCGQEYQVMVGNYGQGREPLFWPKDDDWHRRPVQTCWRCNEALAAQWWRRELLAWRGLMREVK